MTKQQRKATNYPRKSLPEQGKMTVRDFAPTMTGWRGLPVSESYIRKLIREHEQKGKPIPFDYEYEGKKVWILTNKLAGKSAKK